ncbi:hypothetical protein JKF63_05166 [Porcisia hertigi]|uniref:MYND-type domain-containing protein n=1 Tax=Porcisia hertigi TaxID=2761500 RepID=A0A836IJI4_9TRYP|nr:hypothetical protein JKF63_05166 [Porcisia hertigi]
MEDRCLFQFEIIDLRLDTLETLAREQCQWNTRMEGRLSELKARVTSLPQLFSPETVHKERTVSGDDDERKATSASLSADRIESPASISPADDSTAPMCDYCFFFSHNCFPCPRCGREWYCSAACQRLRHRYHASRCGRQCALLGRLGSKFIE